MKRVLSKEEKTKYGCAHCADSSKGGGYALLCEHDECPYEKEFEGYSNYRDWEKDHPILFNAK